MTNTSKVNATNLVYSVPAPGESGNYTGVVITPYPNGAGENCTNIAAGKSCTFTANIPAGSKPGSFTVIATPNGKQNSKTTQSNKSLQDGSISVTANLGLVDVPNTQNQYYILPSNQKITANANGGTNVMLSVWVKQAGDGLNSLNLVDDKGESLTASLINKNATYSQNSILTYLVTIPQGKTLQNIQALSNVCTTLNNRDDNADTACSNNATINLVPQGNGVLTIQPSFTVMNESNPTQVITLTNTGTGNISGITYPSFSAPFNVVQNNCGTNLIVGQSCTLTVNYTPDTANSGTITPVFYYDDDNNGTTEPKDTVMTIQYLAKVAPNPTPGPTPDPTPEPEPPTPFSELDINSQDISLTPANPEQIITLTNTPGGDTAGAIITNLTLPTINAPLESVGTTCGSSLAIGASCSYTIKYSISSTAGATALPITYNNGISQQTEDVVVDWVIKKLYLLMVGGGSSGEGVMSKCTINESNVLINCANTINIPLSTGGGFDGMTFEIVDGAYKLFMANPAQYGTVYMCDYDIVTGDVSSCNVVSPDATIIGNPETPRSVTFHTAKNGTKYAYIVSISASSMQKARNGIYKCDISKTGEITNCAQNIAIPNISSGTALFNDTTNGTKLYYGYLDGWSAGQNGMKVCDVDANGNISNCISANLNVPNFSYYFINWIEFKSFNNVKYMYIQDWADGGLFQCNINEDGTLGVCQNLIDYNITYGHTQFAFNTIGLNTSFFMYADYKPPSSSWTNGVITFSVTNNGSVMTQESTINKNYFTGYGTNGINSVIVSP